MGIVTCNMTMSLDGFISGPQHLDEGFEMVMDWIHQAMASRERPGLEGGDKVDADQMTAMSQNNGAYVMGRTMFDLGEEPWGPDPPYHAPVFVVTHRPRDPLPREGGTTFNFVTEGLLRAVEVARDAAGDKNVQVQGGANVAGQAIRGGIVDELRLHIAPVLLGKGMPLFGEDAAPPRRLELARVVHSERALHLTYRMQR